MDQRQRDCSRRKPERCRRHSTMTNGNVRPRRQRAGSDQLTVTYMAASRISSFHRRRRSWRSCWGPRPSSGLATRLHEADEANGEDHRRPGGWSVAWSDPTVLVDDHLTFITHTIGHMVILRSRSIQARQERRADAALAEIITPARATRASSTSTSHGSCATRSVRCRRRFMRTAPLSNEDRFRGAQGHGDVTGVAGDAAERTIYDASSTDAHLGPAGLVMARDFGAAARRCSGSTPNRISVPKGAFVSLRMDARDGAAPCRGDPLGCVPIREQRTGTSPSKRRRSELTLAGVDLSRSLLA